MYVLIVLSLVLFSYVHRYPRTKVQRKKERERGEGEKKKKKKKIRDRWKSVMEDGKIGRQNVEERIGNCTHAPSLVKCSSHKYRQEIGWYSKPTGLLWLALTSKRIALESWYLWNPAYSSCDMYINRVLCSRRLHHHTTTITSNDYATTTVATSDPDSSTSFSPFTPAPSLPKKPFSNRNPVTLQVVQGNIEKLRKLRCRDVFAAMKYRDLVKVLSERVNSSWLLFNKKFVPELRYIRLNILNMYIIHDRLIILLIPLLFSLKITRWFSRIISDHIISSLVSLLSTTEPTRQN